MFSQITESDEFHQALEDAGNKLVVVYFTASLSGNPSRMDLKFEEEVNWHEDVVFLRVDVNQGMDLAKDWNISSVPTFQFFRNGQMVHEITRANVKGLRQQVDKLK